MIELYNDYQLSTTYSRYACHIVIHYVSNISDGRNISHNNNSDSHNYNTTLAFSIAILPTGTYTYIAIL